MASLTTFFINLASVLIFIPLNALILWALLKLFKLKENKYLAALKVAALAEIILFFAGEVFGLAFNSAVTPTAGIATLAGVGALLLATSLFITVAVNSFLVKKFYNQKTGKAILIGTIWMVANWTLGMVLGAIVFAIAASALIITGARPA